MHTAKHSLESHHSGKLFHLSPPMQMNAQSGVSIAQIFPPEYDSLAIVAIRAIVTGYIKGPLNVWFAPLGLLSCICILSHTERTISIIWLTVNWFSICQLASPIVQLVAVYAAMVSPPSGLSSMDSHTCQHHGPECMTLLSVCVYCICAPAWTNLKCSMFGWDIIAYRERL